MSDKKAPFIPEFFKKKNSPSKNTFVPGWIARGRAGEKHRTFEVAEGRPCILKGGQCIIPYKGIFPMDLKIQDGIVLSTGHNLSDGNATTIDLKGKYISPGIVDPHVHLGIFTPFDTEIVTETRSALLNGVTTTGIYIGGEESYLQQLDDIIRKIEGHSLTDIFIHLVILTREQLEEIPTYYSRYGITSFKTYMCGIPGLIPSVEDDFLMDLMEKVASLGEKAVLNIHAENHRIVDRTTSRLKNAEPDPDSLKIWEESHPGFAEAEAIQRAVYLSKESGARIYFVHLSSKESIKIAEVLKREHSNIYFETTSPYLTMNIEDDTSFLYKMTPPIRVTEDQKALWRGLGEDVVDTIGTDHTPMSMDEKKPSVNLWEILPGYPSVGTHLVSLIDKAQKEHFSLLKLIEKMTAAPAKIFGIYPQKGTLLPGSDADLVIIDPMLEKRATPELAASRSDYCLHEGKRLRGWPVSVIKRGRLVTRDRYDQVKATIQSRYLRRD
jgi:dihydropyrimidinase